jgi:hypothetical protein
MHHSDTRRPPSSNVTDCAGRPVVVIASDAIYGRVIEGAGGDQFNLRTVPTVTGTEEMRAFFQRRLAGAGLVMPILALCAKKSGERTVLTSE